LASTANDIATTQTPAAAGGTATATFTNSSASIAATNTFVAGQLVYFTTTGQLPYPLMPFCKYYVLSTGLTGAAFEVSGNYGGTAITVNTAAVGSSFAPPYWPAAAGTQTVNYGGNVAINGTLVVAGVAVLATPQRVLITTADSTTKFTINGASADGSLLTETVTSNGTSVQSALDYASVSSITVNQLATAAITVGTNGVGSTPWVRLDEWASPSSLIQCDATGTVNYTVQFTLNDPNSPTNPVAPSAVDWINSNDAAAVGATASIQTNALFSPLYARTLLNSGSGSVTMTVSQYSAAPR
jgi:hypothetical protein